MMPSEIKRQRELEDENGRLKRIVADLSLEQRDASGHRPTKALRPVRKRKLDEMRTTWKVRKACRFFALIRRAAATDFVAPAKPPLESRIKEICQTGVRYVSQGARPAAA